MKKRDYKIYSILTRYLILLLIVVFGLPLIYKLFTPLTIYLTVFILDLFYEIATNSELILINQTTFIYIVNACIAGSAYLLLLILNLTIDLKPLERLKSIVYSFALLLVLNVIRISILGALYHHEIPYVEFTHAIFWYGLSTIFVIGIWFITIKKFKIKNIPFYTDLRNLKNPHH